MDDALGFGVVLLVVLAEMFFDSRGLDKLEGRFDRMDSRLDRMQSDLSQFYRDLADHGARIDVLEKRNTAK